MADVKEFKIGENVYDIKAKSMVNQNSGSVKFWTGTKAEYEAITTKDANTLYNITDDYENTVLETRKLFEFIWSDHLFNDMSYLRADEFSWHSGVTYSNAYNELLSEYNNESSVEEYTETETMYAWGQVFFTYSATPASGDTVYHEEGGVVTTGTVNSYDSAQNKITFSMGRAMYATRTADYDKQVPTANAIAYKRTPKGYKIALATEETKIQNKYNTDGIAWFYILDTTNTQFKLPRTKFGFEGLRSSVGDDIAESLPNIKGDVGSGGGIGHVSNVSLGLGVAETNLSGAFYRNTSMTAATGNGGGYSSKSLGFDASLASSTYQNNAPVQERATQMYLYFYVGQFTPSAIQQTAGVTSEVLNQKVDKADLVNCQVVIETYVNGTSGYRIWSDGYCEQWGYLASGSTGNATVNLLKTMLNKNYQVFTEQINTDNDPEGEYGAFSSNNKSVNSFQITRYSSLGYFWKASGYLAEGEY